MAKNLTVYNQLVVSPSECLKTINREIGLKTTCMPFAVKVIESLKTLSVKTENDALNAANVLLSGLQTLWSGGIVAEDYDKIDFVKRGNTIVPSARVEAFLRAAARKGYRITDTIIAVPTEDADTTYFKENFFNGDIIYTLEDLRRQPDRTVNAERLIKKYFSKFICRLDVHEASTNKRVVMTVCEMSIDDLLQVASVSEQGLYKSRWEKYIDDYTKKERKRKVITDELNSGTFWINWTGEMVNKTIIRRALKRIREVLPELKEAIYAFDDQELELEQDDINAPIVIDTPEIPMENTAANVDLNNMTDEQKSNCTEMFNLFVANPKLAEDKTEEIKGRFEKGDSKQSIINDEYASIVALKRSAKKWAIIGGYFDEKD